MSYLCVSDSYTSLSNMLIHGYQVYIRWREWRCLHLQSWRLSMGQMYVSNVHLNLPIHSQKKKSLYPGAFSHSESRQQNRWDWLSLKLIFKVNPLMLDILNYSQLFYFIILKCNSLSLHTKSKKKKFTCILLCNMWYLFV